MAPESLTQLCVWCPYFQASLSWWLPGVWTWIYIFEKRDVACYVQIVAMTVGALFLLPSFLEWKFTTLWSMRYKGIFAWCYLEGKKRFSCSWKVAKGKEISSFSLDIGVYWHQTWDGTAILWPCNWVIKPLYG